MTPDTEIPPELLEHLLKTEGVERTLRLYTERFNAVTARQQSQVDAWKSGFDATIRFAELAIRSLLLLCGGAAVALLSFAGSRGATAQSSLDAYAAAVTFFGGAAAGAVATAGLSYLSQSFFNDAEKRWCQVVAEVLRWGAVALWLGSLFAFYIGVQKASEAVSLSRWEKIDVHQ